ncbi:MAG: AraC family transcriptional regulator [Bacteroidota bacterium]|nr:AraC family transcriptional regulator [Bacteroidota bacterium]MDP4229967.1 AraC family transcriptional regulator [Bacteroidota bacterium]MDP4235674.1 AraC family transcriptional regulator [Bacteroidota bacterium]
MVSIRCKLIVKSEIEKLGLHHSAIKLGEVDIKEPISDETRNTLNTRLKRWGLELMEDKRSILIERIKDVIIETIHYADESVKINFSELLSERLGYSYTYLANIFSETTGSTIEHFVIAHRIERVKELLMYDDLTLNEIAYKLHYSSVAHLSHQFKKVTGLTPTFFKHLRHKRLTGREKIVAL